MPYPENRIRWVLASFNEYRSLDPSRSRADAGAHCAALASKAKGLFQPRAESLRRGFQNH